MALEPSAAGSGQAQHAQQSLPALPGHLQSESHLTTHLASRFHAQRPTATLSSHAILSLNTYTSSSRGPDGGEQGSAMAATKELASRAWARLGHRGENQAVVFLGESGSGKTTLRSHLLSAFLSFSSTPLSNKLSYAAFVFDSLTTTKSALTPTASKAGLFFELQYDTSSAMYPTLIGGKLLDHRLERERVASVPTGERNFHVLYYLLAGTSASEKDHLGLTHPGHVSGDAGNRASVGASRWRYLGHPSQLKVGINDQDGFQQFKLALKKLEFPRNDIAEICQVLATILHIGQLEFVNSLAASAAADEGGHEGGEAVTAVRNKDTLSIIAAFLGVTSQDLELSFAHKTKTLHKERVTVMLDPKGARSNADELARTLYALLVAYIMESINSRTCAVEESVANTISIVDFPGFAVQSTAGQTLDQLLNNAASESLYNVCLQNFFDRQGDMLDTEEVAVPATSYFDNSDAVKGLLKPGNGLLGILDDQSRRAKSDQQFLESIRKRFEGKNPAITVGSATTVLPGSNFATPNAAAKFSVKHYAGEVDYPIEGLMDANAEVISGDMMNLFKSTRSEFVAKLFGQEAISAVHHPKEKSTIMQASIASKPMRMPSMARKKYDRMARLTSSARAPVHEDDNSSEGGSRAGTFGGHSAKADSSVPQGVAAQFMSSLSNVTKSLSAPNTNTYFVICLRPNERRIANQFDTKCVRLQLQTFGIAEISQRLRNADFSVFLPFAEFLGLTEAGSALVGSEKDRANMVIDEKRWPGNEAQVGATGVFLSERCWFDVANIASTGPPSTGSRFIGGDNEDGSDGQLTPRYGDSKLRLIPGASPYNDDKTAYFGAKELDARSDAGLSAFNGNMFGNMDTREQMVEKTNEKQTEVVEEVKVSGSRKRWMFFVWMLTFWIPPFAIRWIVRSPRKDIIDAWREKLAINMLIWLSCGLVMFFMVGFPELICPKQDVFSLAELSSYDGKGKHQSFVAIRGVVYDLGKFIPRHYPNIVPSKDLVKYASTDATNLFPIQVSAVCNGKDGSVDPAVQLDYRNTNYTGTSTLVSTTDPNARYHDFRAFTNDSRPDWWWEQQFMFKRTYQKGRIGYTPQYIETLANKQSKVMASINGRVYDMTAYIQGGRAPRYPVGVDPPSPPPDSNFMDQQVVSLFQNAAGSDATKYWENMNMDSALKSRMQVCLDNLFYVGEVDTRNSTRCLFAKYLLLAISILLVSVICFKFLAALQFGKKNVPENLDKFIICTVPAYTEDEDSLRRAIDSAARMKYDDKRKLLLIVCDGMIIGQGNDRPTPRIVLDILGVSETQTAEPLSFESLGEGMKQHNMGKVYSGLYEVQGHIVPFLVVVKVGKPSEVGKPGNRGKRDSQMILMRFLNRIHYNLPMTPMELEMHHQIRNIIGVNPTFYEFVLQIDADTMVAPDAATRMVASFLHDTRLIGVCGETALSNAKGSMVTMIQVYEYYISHNLTKAFESLFGSVTCLPGCFSMYRVRAAETGKPLFVSKDVIDAYSEIRVDTLHMKNLLHLGEDRYLTTCLLKYHPKYKTKYIFRAHAWTVAPDNWAVFLSQRRRWINSTVHNLIELIPLQQLCGFCCFSMRFIVFLDLLSTIVQPVLMGYIIYLVYLIVLNTSVVPVTAFILLGAIYGLQAIIFIIRRKWEMVGWMIIYVIATPIFSFALPLYSFWHMDDFSWGNTRIVTGDQGKKLVISDEGKFDPESIPRKRWEEYSAELWDMPDAGSQWGGNHPDDRSEVSGVSYATKSYAGGYGSRPASQLDLTKTGNSRMNLAATSYGALTGEHPLQHSLEMSDMASNHGLMGPSDDVLLAEIRDILNGADLMRVTKKLIKAELEERLGCNLDSRKEYINTAVEAILSGQL